jgi:hypothetical protein
LRPALAAQVGQRPQDRVDDQQVVDVAEDALRDEQEIGAQVTDQLEQAIGDIGDDPVVAQPGAEQRARAAVAPVGGVGEVQVHRAVGAQPGGRGAVLRAADRHHVEAAGTGPARRGAGEHRHDRHRRAPRSQPRQRAPAGVHGVVQVRRHRQDPLHPLPPSPGPTAGATSFPRMRRAERGGRP